MNTVGFHDYYDLLGISMNASRQEVLNAYQKMRVLYGDPNSNANEYFSADELIALRDILEKGYLILSHPLKRAAYNEALKKAYPQKYSHQTSKVKSVAIPAEVRQSFLDRNDFDGVFLKQMREHMNMSVNELSDITRIKPEYLEALESNRYDELPAGVFVRGFVSQISKFYGLDEKKICESYMSRFNLDRG
jgi:flagellar biosynthesis protein FlhG